MHLNAIVFSCTNKLATYPLHGLCESKMDFPQNEIKESERTYFFPQVAELKFGNTGVSIFLYTDESSGLSEHIYLDVRLDYNELNQLRQLWSLTCVDHYGKPAGPNYYFTKEESGQIYLCINTGSTDTFKYDTSKVTNGISAEVLSSLDDIKIKKMQVTSYFLQDRKVEIASSLENDEDHLSLITYSTPSNGNISEIEFLGKLIPLFKSK